MEAEIVSRAGIPFRAIPAAGLHGVGLSKLPANATRLLRGFFASLRILRSFRPDALVMTGGYVAVPMALAGWRIPTLLFVPDIEPGLALKFLAKFADRIAATVAQTKAYFGRNERVAVTGYPLRRDLGDWTRDRAMKHMGLVPATPTVLVVGGSLGAHSLNLAVFSHLAELLESAQVVHITGLTDWSAAQDVARLLPEAIAGRYHLRPFLHEMGAALSSADLVVSRAGASTLGEYPFFGLPAILVPYPHAWRYQKVNADYLASRGAAIILEDAHLDQLLVGAVRDLLQNPAKRAAMGEAMRSLAQPRAAEEIAGHLRALAG